MGGLLKQIQDAMAAVSFAEAGEWETAKEIIGREKDRHTVLLALEGACLSEKAFLYAHNLCNRINTLLEILYVVKPNGSLLERWKAARTKQNTAGNHLTEAFGRLNSVIPALKLEETIHRVTVKIGSLEREVPRYIDGHKGIALAVVAPPGRKAWPNLEKRLSTACNERGIPLVVMTPKNELCSER